MAEWGSNLKKHIDVVALVVAGILGIVLYHLGIIPSEFLISLILLLLSIHVLQQAVRDEEVHNAIMSIYDRMKDTPEVELIKPENLFSRGEEFALLNRGEMWWFNTPIGFRHREIFDKLLKPAIENPKTSKIIFILRPQFKEIWEKDAMPKIMKTNGKDKVLPPVWRDIEEDIAFKMIDLSAEKEEKEAHMTILGEPFIMERERDKDIAMRTYHPRYLFYIRTHSELIPRLKELFLKYKLKSE